MKSFIRIFLVLILSIGTAVFASDFEKISYKNIQDGDKLAVSEDGETWTNKIDRKQNNYFVKKVSVGTGSYSEFYSPEGEFLFSTATQYEFINKGSLIGYSNHDLKFYEFIMNENVLQPRELTESEVQELFPDYRIVKISDFTTTTNSLKIKRGTGKFILLNDTDKYFYHYGFTSNNAKFRMYPLKGFLKITKKGMIHFSHFGDNTKDNPWFILLVR